MSAPDTPLDGWQALHDGLCGMIDAEAKMNSEPDGYFEADFDTSATLAMEGFAALCWHPGFLAEIVRIAACETKKINLKERRCE